MAVAFLCLAQAAAQHSNAPPLAFPPLSLEAQGLTNTAPASAPGPTNDAISAAWRFFTATNATAQPDPPPDFLTRLAVARHLRLVRQFTEAAAACIGLVQSQAPEKVQRAALLELGQIALDQNNLPRAGQIYAQCLAQWPQDPGVPELLLRQGLVFRKMGLPGLAITKFYSVMTTALMLKTERFDYHKQLVQLAQYEIAKTHYELANYEEAAASFDRLLKSDSPPVNPSLAQYQYIHCLVGLGRLGEAVTQAQDFLERFPAAPERPEVRFLCATSLKEAGRDAEALRQVLDLLQEQHTTTPPEPQTLAFWQRRAGNEIANRFYLEGDPLAALDVYLCLAALDSSAEWQLPVFYQIGLVFERLHDQAKAIEYFDKVLSRQKELPASAPASLKTVLEMAKWRKDFLAWQTNAELVSLEWHRTLASPPKTNANDHALPTASHQ